METRAHGRTGLDVSVLGLGAGQVGRRELDEATAGRLLNGVLDAGITLLDTARCYGLSEERIGRHLSGRRGEFVLSSKTGHDVEGVEDWTAEAVRIGVEESLTRLRTDHIDIVHLHSCSLEALQRPGLIEELEKLVTEGKIGVAAYSGDNAALAWAAASGRFGALETSVNLADQWSLNHVLPTAQEQGLGVIAKRPIANAWWKYDTRPDGVYGEVYWDRMQVLGYESDLDPMELALRFSAYAPGVTCAITGSANLDNLQRNIAAVEKGPLPDDVVQALRSRWSAVAKDDDGTEWNGQT